ncbi:MAG: ribonuclease III [Elusimicrobia bacterium]|nr:ribonuclease III [Elusimicrobiota bacterium]
MYDDIEKIINYTFVDKELIKEALTHKSYAGEQRRVKHNERLEFLGDSVLGLAAADHIYRCRPGVEEGVLSKVKSSVVSRKNLFLWASAMGLGKFLNLGAGEEATGGRERESILSNAMEALIGAVYLDGGYAEAKRIVDGLIAAHEGEEPGADWKSKLQEYAQKNYKTVPRYEIVQTVGPEHEKIFTVSVSAGKKELARGKGKNKKLAEQDAAKNALDNLKI